jgi:putative endonuclease
MMKYYCYIISNKNRVVRNIGYTEDLQKRLQYHKNGGRTKFIEIDHVWDFTHLEDLEFKNEAKAREKH